MATLIDPAGHKKAAGASALLTSTKRLRLARFLAVVQVPGDQGGVTMRRQGVWVTVGSAVAVGGAALGVFALTRGDDKPQSTARTAPASTFQQASFPSAHDQPPPGWTGPVFRLSQAYPSSRPVIGSAPWRQLSFRTQPAQYLRAVLDYALEGNTAVDFRGQDNSVREWFHAPWMHAGPSGREFIHGLTRERVSRPRELAPTQTSNAQNWAVSMYNPRGGYVLGQVWKNSNAPDPGKAVFPEGTVAFKLLFTSASVSQVPYLDNSLTWQADINRASGAGPRPQLRLLQIDVAVRDRRANSTTGWIFGTFVYNGKAPGATVWDRMMPVGLMWGNDPNRLQDDKPLAETVIINPQLHPVKQHLGFKGRLNGPVDNPRSSCLSCHSTAQIASDLSRPNVSGIPPANASDAVLARYFRNIAATDPFSAGQLALDYSLQLQNGIANRAQAGGLRSPSGRSGARQQKPLDPSKGVKVKAVQR